MLPEIRFHLERTLVRVQRMLGSLETRGWGDTMRRLVRSHEPALQPRTGRHVALQRDGRLLLVVDSELPRPDRDSGSMRLANLMQLLREDGYRIAFIADDGRLDIHYADSLRGAGVEVVDGSPTAWLRRHAAELHGAILCRHVVAGHWLSLVRGLAPGAHVVFDTVDLHYLRETRQARHNRSRSMTRRAKATQASEVRLVSLADTTWVVSDDERLALAREAPGARVVVVSNAYGEVLEGRPYAERSGLLFVGGHRHPPNTDAVRWLLDDIFPRIKAHLPDVQLHLAGPDMPDDLRLLAEGSGGVVLHGHVPDLEPLLQGCRVAVAPLRFGAGVKGKINLSMARGQPVITTSCGAEGMHLRPGVDVLVADDPGAFADATAKLYRDPVSWQSIAENGRDSVRRHFSFDAARVALRQTFTPAT